MNQRRRLVLLGIYFLTALGTGIMLFGDTHWAQSIGALFAGIGVAIGWAPIFDSSEPPRYDTARQAQESELILPSYYPQKRKVQKLDLILPASFHYSQQRQEQARRKQQREKVVNLTLGIASRVLIVVPMLGIMYLFIQYVQYQAAPIDLSIKAPAVQIIQHYCAAMERQDYSTAYSYSRDLKIGGQDIADVSTFTQKARQKDWQGHLINCTVKSGEKVLDTCHSSYSGGPFCSYNDRFAVDVRRSNGSRYFVHITIFPDGETNYKSIMDIDKL